MYVQAIIDEICEFCEGFVVQTPKMYSLAMTYGFIVPSSASVERVFSYFNKVLTKIDKNLLLKPCSYYFYVDAKKV